MDNKMQKKNLQILGIFTFIIYFVFLLHFLSASDLQASIACGGDNQTMIGCIGDTQLTSLVSVGLIQPAPPNQTNQSNQSNQTTIIVNNIVSGGGGGATTVVQENAQPGFTVSSEELSVLLTQGQVDTEQLTITNTQSTPLSIIIQPSASIQSFIKLSDDSFTLNPSESKTISIDVIATDTVTPNLYVGKLTLTAGGPEVDVFTAINVESKNPLLDVAINLPNTQIAPGETMLTGITLYNLGSSFGDVALEYLVEDDSGNVILNQTDTVAIQTQTSFIKNLIIPNDAPLGHYTLYVRAVYTGKIASASTGFDIVNVSPKEKIYIITIIGLVVLIAAFIGFIILKRVKKKYKQIKRIGLEDLMWK